MGWKSVKDYYDIGHKVTVTEKGICIGSPYIHDLIVIGLDGAVRKWWDGSSTNEDLVRYQEAFKADPDKLRELVLADDVFEKSIPVYTYDAAEIILKYCEKLGWPNITHDGEEMHDNTFSADKAKVVRWAKEDAEAGIKQTSRFIETKKKEVEELTTDLEQDRANLKRLNDLYPDDEGEV